MRTLTSVALAGALAASAVAATATSAGAGEQRHGPYPPTYNTPTAPTTGYYYGPDAGAVAAGAIIGLAFGALAAQAFAPTPYYYYPYPPAPPPPFYPGYLRNRTRRGAPRNTRTYNPETNTWIDFHGVVHVCNGPY